MKSWGGEMETVRNTQVEMQEIKLQSVYIKG